MEGHRMIDYISKETFNEIASKHFDIEDTETRKVLLSLDEEGQNSTMTSLASKLYDSIIDKITEIDFGSITSSAGDITKIENYDKLVECLQVMKSFIAESKQDTSSITIIETGISNILARREAFTKAYKYDIELPMVIYNTMTLACVASLSFLIACCVEFVKTPKDKSFEIVVNKVSAFKTENYLLFKNLDKFNKACANGSLDKMINSMINSKAKNLSGVATVLIITGVSLALLILLIIPAIRELIFFFYFLRTKASDFFAVQANLLEMNASTIEYNSTMDPNKRKEIQARQLKDADTFRKLSNFLEVKMKEAGTKATKGAKDSDKKYKISDVTDKMPDSAAANTAANDIGVSLF